MCKQPAALQEVDLREVMPEQVLRPQRAPLHPAESEARAAREPLHMPEALSRKTILAE
jgi:hypothetical protein